MGGFVGKAVGAVTGGLLGGLTGSAEAEAEGTQQMANNGLQAGDIVALLPVNGGNNFIVLGKLIYAPEISGETTDSSSSGSGNSSVSGGSSAETVKSSSEFDDGG